MDSPMHGADLAHVSKNVKIKSETIDIVEVDDRIFSTDGYYDDESQELQNFSYGQHIDDEDNRIIVKEEIICKEEPVFYDVLSSEIVSESQMNDTAKLGEKDQQMDSAVFATTRLEKGKPRIYECYICKHPTPTIYSMRSHFVQHIGNLVYDCEHCSATFKGMWNYARHINQEHGKTGRNLTCTFCYRAFDGKRRLENHLRIHTGNKPFECLVCRKRFNTKSSFKTHKKIHTGERPFPCDQCPMRFRWKKQLDSHCKTYTNRAHPKNIEKIGENQLICRELPSMHPVNEHLMEARTYQCYLCGIIETKTQLKIHMKTMHVGDKLFNCKICKKVFIHHCSLVQHMRIHSRTFQYECDICGRKFQKKDGLKVHMQVKHSQQKKFQCKVCMKFLYDKSTFAMHMRRHSGFKPFQCSFCAKFFVKKGDMMRHTRTHTGERPYKCDMCKMTFTRNNLLTDHKKKIHGMKC